MFIDLTAVEKEEENLSSYGQHVWRSHHFTPCSVTKWISRLLWEFYLSVGGIMFANTTLDELNYKDQHFSTTFSVGFIRTVSSRLSLTGKSNIKVSRVCYWTSWLWGRFEFCFVHRRFHGLFFSENQYLSLVLQIRSQPIPSTFFVNYISLTITGSFWQSQIESYLF